MTRDEAVKLIGANMYRQYPEAWVDNFVALGMLKLDEPKSAAEKFRDCLYATSWSERSAENLLLLIEKAGLKIVEK